MIVIGVHKRFNKATRTGFHPRAKPHWHVFFLDDLLKFHTKKISALQVPYYLLQKVSRLQFVCDVCGCKFISMTKKNAKFSPCPNGCDEAIT